MSIPQPVAIFCVGRVFGDELFEDRQCFLELGLCKGDLAHAETKGAQVEVAVSQFAPYFEFGRVIARQLLLNLERRAVFGKRLG